MTINPVKLKTEDRSFEIDQSDLDTLMAHGLVSRNGDDYRLTLRTEMMQDPGSVGVNHPDPGAIIAVIKAALAARPMGTPGGKIKDLLGDGFDQSLVRNRPFSSGSPDRDSIRILRQFAEMYRSGAQGCEMDFESAQALALAIDDVLSVTSPTASN